MGQATSRCIGATGDCAAKMAASAWESGRRTRESEVVIAVPGQRAMRAVVGEEFLEVDRDQASRSPFPTWWRVRKKNGTGAFPELIDEAALRQLKSQRFLFCANIDVDGLREIARRIDPQTVLSWPQLSFYR